MQTSGCWKTLAAIFQMLCILGAATTLLWCCWEYSKNEDVVEVKFRKYADAPESVYPDITLCFESPFIEEKLKLYGEEISTAKYKYFLMGEYFDERMLKIDYETVSIQFDRYLLGKILKYSSSKGKIMRDNSSIGTIISIAHVNSKCFTLHTPVGKQVMTVTLKLKNSIFSSGFRPRNAFKVVLHYPEQLHKGWKFVVKNWLPRGEKTSKSYQTDINVKDVEVLRRRNRSNNGCKKNSLSTVNTTREKIMTLGGCKPPYWQDMSSEIPHCNTQDQLEDIRHLNRMAITGTGMFQNEIPPCNEIQKIGFDFFDTDFDVKEVFEDGGTDMDLDMPSIRESWVANSKLQGY